MASPASTSAAQSAFDFGSWRTIELKIREDLSNFEGDYAWTYVTEHYVESRVDGRYSETRCLKGDVTVNRRADYTDGSKAAWVIFKDQTPELQNGVIIKRDFALEDQYGHSSRPMPIGFYYVGRSPLHDALPKATYLGTDRVNGKECHAFLFERLKYAAMTQDLVYDLDATSATPLKVVSYVDAAARASGTPLWAWTCQKVETTQGHEIPSLSAMNSFAADGKTITGTNTFTVESVKFDQDYPASTFWPTYQPGITVFDSIANKRIVVPGGPPETAEIATVVPPSAALPPRDWSSTTSTVTLALGIAVLLAGGLLWWRRR